MDGTCIETPAQINPDGDEPHVYTFHSDILPIPELTEGAFQNRKYIFFAEYNRRSRSSQPQF